MTDLYNSQIAQIMPVIPKNTPEVQAISYALNKAIQRIMNKVSQSMVYAGIDELPEQILDVLAVELRSLYYEPDLDIEVKRTIIKNTLYLYSQAGTPAAVEEMIQYVFGSGELVEWFDNGGEPGTFEIRTTTQITAEIYDTFAKVVKRVKNARSHLMGIKFGNKLEMGTQIAMGMTIAKTTTIK